MRVHVVKTSPHVPRGRMFLAANREHPEARFTTANVDEAESLFVFCHPDDEQSTRDTLAVAQEHGGDFPTSRASGETP